MEDDNNTASKLIANDVKEIIDKMLCEFKKYPTDNFIIKNEESKILLDYITNLQQENQELNDSITWWNNRFNAVQRDYEDYKSKIEKAIPMLKELNIKLKGILNTGIDIKEISDIKDTLNGRSDE